LLKNVKKKKSFMDRTRTRLVSVRPRQSRVSDGVGESAMLMEREGGKKNSRRGTDCCVLPIIYLEVVTIPAMVV
jgi:hypothetical protein